jgi:hypothetical protein
MVEITNEIEARYHVVTLLYHGQLQEAESALDAFVNNGTITGENEAFYRFLLDAAHRYTAERDDSFKDFKPSPRLKRITGAIDLSSRS